MSTGSGESSSKDHQSPFTKPWFLVSAGVVAVIVILAVVYALLPPVGQQAAPPQTTQPVVSGSPSSATDGGASVCGLPAGDQRLPAIGQATRWELLGKTAVPTDPKVYGPGKTDNGVRTCFANNPTGALYAAANFTGYSSEGKPDLMFKYLAAKGPARDKYLDNPPSFVPRDGSLSLQIAGYRIVSFTNDLAVIQVGIGGSNGVKLLAPYTLKWEDGDWKVLVTETQPSQVTDFSNLVPWAGA